MRVTDELKGELADSLLVVQPPVPQRGECYDYVDFTGDDAVLVFLRRDEAGVFRVVGSHDGKHRVGDPTTEWILKSLGRPPN
jgi:hypothetical protein